MTFQQLRYILEVHKTGSVSKAAENLFVTRPSVSLSISSLEAELGYPLFTRTQQGLIPSARGRLVLEYASRICETQRQITNIGKEDRSRITIATVNYPPFSNAEIRLLDEFKDRNDISFCFNNNHNSISKLAFFELDIAFSTAFNTPTSDMETQIISRNLDWKELRQIPIYICIGPGHPLYHIPDLTIKDFKNYKLLDTSTFDFTRSKNLQNFIGYNPAGAISSYYPVEGYEILQAGLAYKICRKPQQRIIDAYQLRYIPIEGVYQRLFYLANPMRPLTPEAERFLEILHEELDAYQD